MSYNTPWLEGDCDVFSTGSTFKFVKIAYNGVTKMKTKSKLVKYLLFLSFMLATAIILCVPVSAHLDVEPGHTVAQTSTVYVLPDSSSESVGSVWDADVSVFWREGNYYYIEYAVSSGSYGGYKRGYIHKDNISVSWHQISLILIGKPLAEVTPMMFGTEQALRHIE